MRGRRFSVVALVSLLSASVLAMPADAQSQTLTFVAIEDTNVSSQRPARSYGSAVTVEVDASPIKQGFLKFSLSGLDGYRITSARLGMYQVDSASTGGRVYKISSNGWTEAMTWSTRPAIDGPHVATYGGVQAGRWYEVDVTTAVTGNGTISFAIDSPSTNGSDWASSESATAPRLVVDVASATEPPGPSGLTEVATPTQGSSDPTNFTSNHRVVTTSGGRLLTLYGLHRRGVQLEWKDPGSPWTTRTTGATVDGVLHDNGSTGDRPASIAIARDATGKEHAWVVWSGESTWSATPVSMRRLTDLDSPSGPTVGPEVIVDAPAYSAYKPDIAFETGPGGAMRGTILWTRKVGDTVHEVMTAWFTDLGSATPTIHDRQVLATSSSSTRFGTLVSTTAGMRAVVRSSSGYIRTYGHDTATPLTSWWTGAATTFATDSYSTPSAAPLASGEVLAAVERDSVNGIVTVQRFSATGVPAAPELTLTGYSHPTIASNGTRAWLVMVRRSDGFVVSRHYSLASGWSSADAVEIGSEGGGSHEYPNAATSVGDNLVFVVRGPQADSSHSSVLALERRI